MICTASRSWNGGEFKHATMHVCCFWKNKRTRSLCEEEFCSCRPVASVDARRTHCNQVTLGMDMCYCYLLFSVQLFRCTFKATTRIPFRILHSGWSRRIVLCECRQTFTASDFWVNCSQWHRSNLLFNFGDNICMFIYHMFDYEWHIRLHRELGTQRVHFIISKCLGESFHLFCILCLRIRFW